MFQRFPNDFITGIEEDLGYYHQLPFGLCRTIHTSAAVVTEKLVV
jgi:hypothetical protein